MRIAVVALDDPWERPHGGTLRTRSIVDACRDLGHQTHVIYSGVLPEPASRPQGVSLHPVASRPLGERQVPGVVSRLKRAVLPLPTLRGGYIAGLAEQLRSLGDIDVLSVSQLRATQYLNHAAGQPRLWLDQADVWSGMLEPEIARRRGVSRAGATAQRQHILRAERRWFGLAGAVTAAGYADAARISAVSGAPARWMPNAVAAPTSIPTPPDHPTVGLLGNFDFWPNRDAYELLRHTWAPRLAAAGVHCVVAGYGSRELPAAPGVDRIGPVAAPSDFYARVSATVAPIRLGGGIKVKIAESLAYDRPVIATAKALEGFEPAIRGRVATVDPDNPDLGDVQAMLAPDPGLFADARERFSPLAFRAAVEQTLKALAR